MSNRATVELLDRVRAALGPPGAPCTDYRVAKELKVTRSTVSRWRTGDAHMNGENVWKAAQMIGSLRLDAVYWFYRVSAERDGGATSEMAKEMLEDIEDVRAGRKPREDGLFAALATKSKYVLALACLGWMFGIIPEPAPFTPTGPSAPGFDRSIHYANSRARRRAWRPRRHRRVMPLTA